MSVKEDERSAKAIKKMADAERRLLRDRLRLIREVELAIINAKSAIRERLARYPEEEGHRMEAREIRRVYPEENPHGENLHFLLQHGCCALSVEKVLMLVQPQPDFEISFIQGEPLITHNGRLSVEVVIRSLSPVATD
jgi:hypothetical protein